MNLKKYIGENGYINFSKMPLEEKQKLCVMLHKAGLSLDNISYLTKISRTTLSKYNSNYKNKIEEKKVMDAYKKNKNKFNEFINELDDGGKKIMDEIGYKEPIVLSDNAESQPAEPTPIESNERVIEES